jgi:raffinose/stachyose/melibiose transport system permease protein
MQFINYFTAWTSGKIGVSFFNSVVVSVSSIAVSIIVSSMAAFAIKRFRWKLSGFAMGIFLIGIMIPIHSTLIPLFLAFNTIGILNHYISLILPYVAFALPTSIFILGGFMASFPREIEEAAVMDGCKMRTVFWRMIFPLSKSSLATISIFNFVAAWNELMLAVTFISKSQFRTITVGIQQMVGQYSTQWGPIGAGLVIATIPTMIIYCLMNKEVQKSFVTGAVN